MMMMETVGNLFEPLTPTAEQEEAIVRMVWEPSGAALNASTMGAGKTLKAVEVVKRRGDRFVLLIAPLGTRLGWKTTFERQGVDLPFKWLNSTKQGKAYHTEWMRAEPGIYFVGTEYFVRLGWNNRARTKTWAQEPDIVLFDEAHRSQNRHSKTYKTLKQLEAPFKLSMSGTPTGNSFTGAYAVTKWLWPDHVENSFYNWRDRWCALQKDYFDPSGYKVVGEKNPGAFFNSLPCYIRLESELDVPLVEEQVFVELSATQRRAYEALEKEMVVWVEDNPLVVEFPVTLRTRLRQATLGMFSVTDEGDVVFKDDCKSSKLDALEDILENRIDGESALILTDSRKFANVVCARVPSAVPWHGEVSQAQREKYKKAFVAGEVKYVVAVISAIAEGVDGLQHATRNMVWLSRSDNRILNEQAMKRVHRNGQKRQVRSFDIVALDTYDSGVISDQLSQALDMNRTLKSEHKLGGAER
jgi:superfamily II DNA or RNA helicase